MASPKICQTMADAAADVPNGITLLVPGFGVGQPYNLLTALYYQGAGDITVVQNGAANVGTDDRVKGIGNFVQEGRIRKIIASFTAATRPSQASQTEKLAREGKL